MKSMLMAFAAATALAAASPAAATIVINVGPGALQPEENVLFNNSPAPGATIEGVTNQTGTFLTVSGGETLVAAGGQARLDTSDGKISSPFTYFGLGGQLAGFNLTNAALAFTTAEFRLFGGTATQATLTFVDTTGQVFTRIADIPKSGFFSAQAIDGQLIDYFSIAANGTLGDVRQIRIGGVQAVPTGVIPEPATWAMMIMGLGGAGAMMRRRRQMLTAA